MPACSMARATIFAVGLLSCSRPGRLSSPGQWRCWIADMMPGRAAPDMVPGRAAPSRSRRQTRRRPVPERSHCRLGADRKISGSMNGTRPPRLVALWCLSRSASFLAFRLASLSGLSVVVSLPPFSHVHVPASPESRPGRLLISIRKKPKGAKTSRSTSFTEPSRAMNSKSDQARQGSLAGKRSRTNSRASRSHGKGDSANDVQFEPAPLALAFGDKGFPLEMQLESLKHPPRHTASVKSLPASRATTVEQP